MTQAIWLFKVRDYSTELVGRRDAMGFYVERGDGTKYHYDNDRIVEYRLVTPVDPVLHPKHQEIIGRAAGVFYSLDCNHDKMIRMSEELLRILEPPAIAVNMQISFHTNPYTSS